MYQYAMSCGIIIVSYFLFHREAYFLILHDFCWKIFLTHLSNHQQGTVLLQKQYLPTLKIDHASQVGGTQIPT